MKRLLKRIRVWLAKIWRTIKRSTYRELHSDVDIENVVAVHAVPDGESGYPVSISITNNEDIIVDVYCEVLDKVSSGNVNATVRFCVNQNETICKEVYVSQEAYMLDFRKSVFITDTGETYYMHKRCVPASNISIMITVNEDGTMKLRKTR